MRILIADDDRLSARILQASLEGSGYEVLMARNGIEALHILQSEDSPRLAILDWMMPEMDGLEVCRKIRSMAGAYIYVLLLTANIDPAGVVAGMDAGADDYIKKPFSPEELQARLRSGRRIVELEEKLRVQATHDSLTGLLNRGAIMERLVMEIERAGRDGAPLSIAMVDIDHFKNVNDTCGHAAGDAVLCRIARKLRETIRPYDFIGRYGGEEFIFVLPNCDTSMAIGIAERLRRSVASEAVEAEASVVRITVSVGVAQAQLDEIFDAESLIRSADAALFKAKEAGRNKVESAPSKLSRTFIGSY